MSGKKTLSLFEEVFVNQKLIYKKENSTSYCCCWWCFVLAGTAACEKCTSSKLTLAALSLIAHMRKAVA